MVPLGLFQQALHDIPGWTHRQGFMAVHPRQMDVLGQARRAPAALLGEAEESTQGVGVVVDGAPRVAVPGDLLHEGPVDLDQGELGEILRRDVEVVEETQEVLAVSLDRMLGQPPFAVEILGEGGAPVGMGARWWRRGLEQAVQETQPGGGEGDETLSGQWGALWGSLPVRPGGPARRL